MKAADFRRFIVSFNNVFLKNVTEEEDGIYVRWTWSAYEAWQAEEYEDALAVALRIGGIVREFNPITGSVTYG